MNKKEMNAHIQKLEILVREQSDVIKNQHYYTEKLESKLSSRSRELVEKLQQSEHLAFRYLSRIDTILSSSEVKYRDPHVRVNEIEDAIGDYKKEIGDLFTP